METKLERISQLSRENPNMVFTSIGHLINKEMLKSCHEAKRIQCLSPAKKYKLYKSSINKSIHFVQRSLSSSPREQRVTVQLNLSRE